MYLFKHLIQGAFLIPKRRKKMDCKHTIQMLEGRADGIHCKGCGQVFKQMPGQTVEKKEPEETAPEEPKKEPAKKTTKGGKK